MASREGSTHPRAFGEELQRLRASAGLSLEDIVAETKISRRVLEGLEKGRFQFLPEPVFSRNFVRQYGRTIGCDEDRLAAAFDDAWQSYQLASGSHPALILDTTIPDRNIPWRFWFPIAIGALILIVVAVVILRGSEPADDLMPDPRRRVTVHPMPVLAPTSVPVSTSELPLPPPTTEPDVVTLLVQVENDQECWIHYRDREGMTDQRLLNGGELLQLELIGPIKLTVGNAGAVTLTVAGMEYSDLGVPGQVVHTEVSHDGLVALGAATRHD